MSAPALALAPVLTTTGTRAGANTGTGQDQDHRYHAPRGNTDGKQEGSEGGHQAALPGRGRPLSPSCQGARGILL